MTLYLDYVQLFHIGFDFSRKKNHPILFLLMAFFLLLFYIYIYIQGDAFNLRHSNISKNKHTMKKC